MMWVRFPSPAPSVPAVFRVGSALAHIAQAVEHFLGKEEVTGSSPVVGTRLEEPRCDGPGATVRGEGEEGHGVRSLRPRKIREARVTAIRHGCAGFGDLRFTSVFESPTER